MAVYAVEADAPKARLALQNIRRMMEMRQLWHHVHEVRLVTADRVFFEAGHTLAQALDVATAHGIFSKGPSSGGPHRLVRQIYPEYPRWEEAVSWRLNKRPSLQVTLTRAHSVTWRTFGDADIDLSGPMDVWGALVHLLEVLVPGKTSHRKLEARISREYEAWSNERKAV